MSAKSPIELDVAIVGGGFAGVYCAKTLGKKTARGRRLRVGLISEKNYMVFQPLLPEVVGASVSPRHVVNPLRLLCRHADVLKGAVEKIDWPNKSLLMNAGDFAGRVEVRFEHLVLALGARIDLRRIPGMPEHAFLMQNAGDAMFLRATIVSRIEEANLEARADVRKRLLTFVVVGGGFSGVETAGQILDLFGVIHKYYPRVSWEDLAVYLVHSRDHVLPTLNRRLGEYTATQLRRRGLNLWLNERVRSVTAERVYLESGRTIETNTVISTVGNAPHPLVMTLCEDAGLAAEKGRVLTEATLQVKGHTHLWAAGDCAAVPLVGDGYCPDTAQFAIRHGQLIGENLLRTFRGESLRSFTFKGLGELAAIGHHRAVAQIFGFQFSGLFAWWLWRTIYLGKLPGFDRKLRVVIDWTLELFCPRDINLLNPRFTTVLKEIYLEKDSTLYRRGEPAFSFYIVKSGCIEIGDNRGVVQTVGAGEYFGERALLEDREWHFDAWAKEPTVLVSVPAETFYQIVHGSGSLGRLFHKSAAKYQSREILQRITGRLPREMLDRQARDIMRREVTTLRPDMTVREAIEVTRKRPHSTYPVVDGDWRILGVMQREDFHEFLGSAEANLESPLRDLSFVALPLVRGDVPVQQVMETIIRGGASKALVCDDNRVLQGIITLMDLVVEEKKSKAEMR